MTRYNQLHPNEKISSFAILDSNKLELLCQLLPRNETEFANIDGIGISKAKQYGKEFVLAINQFCTDNNIQRQRQLDENYEATLQASDLSQFSYNDTQNTQFSNMITSPIAVQKRRRKKNKVNKFYDYIFFCF